MVTTYSRQIEKTSHSNHLRDLCSLCAFPRNSFRLSHTQLVLSISRFAFSASVRACSSDVPTADLSLSTAARIGAMAFSILSARATRSLRLSSRSWVASSSFLRLSSRCLISVYAAAVSSPSFAQRSVCSTIGQIFGVLNICFSILQTSRADAF